MALIASDMMRSTLELAYPIATLTSGVIDAGSRYCQVGGVFTSDFFRNERFHDIYYRHSHCRVRLQSKTHSGVDTKVACGDGGTTYSSLWVVLPAFLAGLAFINTPAYIPHVTWCYLPDRRLMWRSAFAWGPPYFIFFTISVLYIVLDIYVRRAYGTIDIDCIQNGNDEGFEFGSEHAEHGPNAEAGELAEQPLTSPAPSHIQQKLPYISPPVCEQPEPREGAKAIAWYGHDI